MANEKKTNLVKELFGSLFNNQKCIDSSKNRPWWVALIIGLVSVVVALVPTFVNLATTQGSSLFSSYSYNYDAGISSFAKGIDQTSQRFLINEESHLLTYEENDGSSWAAYGSNKEWKIEVRTSSSTSFTTEYSFIVKYVNSLYTNATSEDFQNIIGNEIYEVGTTTQLVGDKDELKSYYSPNMLVIFKDAFFVLCYKSESTDVAFNTSGFDYENMSGEWISDYFLANSANNVNQIWKNFMNILNKGYLSTRQSALWMSTGVYAAVFAGMLLILGFMLFLMTRGKHNMFNYMTFNDCMKISCWSAICPGLISLIVGFLIPSYATMIFILCMGLRAMWISMKQLKPQM